MEKIQLNFGPPDTKMAEMEKKLSQKTLTKMSTKKGFQDIPGDLNEIPSPVIHKDMAKFLLRNREAMENNQLNETKKISLETTNIKNSA